jgi:hypothetical protein
MEITFDPKTHTEPPIGTIDSKSIYFVSDKIISNEELKNATYETVYVNTDDPSQTTIVADKLNAEDWALFEQLGFVTEDYALLPSVFVIIRKNNTTLPLTDFVFERQGVYALYEANTNYVRKITTPAQVKTLDPMFLPMAEIVNEVLAGFPNTGDAATGRRLDFIQSSGSQYINTGVIPNATTEIEMQYSVQSILTNGCHMLSNSNFYFPFPRSYDGEYSFLASRLGRSLKITLVPTVNTIYTIKAFQSNKIIINGTEYGTLEHGGGTSTEPLYMNTFGGAPGNAAYTAPAKLYYCKIWQNGALVRDFIPYNSSSGEVGMLDLVENKLYKSDGTAQFTAGNLMGYVLRSDAAALPNAEEASF